LDSGGRQTNTWLGALATAAGVAMTVYVVARTRAARRVDVISS
jgi:hypothetical protein